MNNRSILLAVPNISEGRDLDLVATIAVSDLLLDVHSDPDHNRSVLTYGGEPSDVADAVFEMVGRTAATLDLRDHVGVHPRFGVVDVLPFVEYRHSEDEAQRVVADLTWRIAQGPGIPVYTYDRASPEGRSLPDLRRHLRTADEPRHPTAGVICIGIRGPLVAFNVNIDASLTEVRRIASELRRPGIRALAFEPPSRGLTQISMNLTDPMRIGPLKAFTLIGELTSAVVDAEIVGLVPEELLADLADVPLIAPARSIEDALSQARPG